MSHTDDQAVETYAAWLELQNIRPPKRTFRMWGSPPKANAEEIRIKYQSAYDAMTDDAAALFDKMVAEHLAREA